MNLTQTIEDLQKKQFQFKSFKNLIRKRTIKPKILPKLQPTAETPSDPNFNLQTSLILIETYSNCETHNSITKRVSNRLDNTNCHFQYALDFMINLVIASVLIDTSVLNYSIYYLHCS